MSKPDLDPQFKQYVSDKPKITYAKDDDPAIRRLVISALERIFGRRKIEKIYFDLKSRPFDIETFFKEALTKSQITVNYDGFDPAHLPKEGPLIFLANHPFGIVDGMVFCDLAVRSRGDFRIMINAMLCQDQELAPYFLPVDFEQSKQAMRTNIRSKQLAMQCMSQNIPVLVFPSGMVSTAGKLGFGKVRDGEWTTFAAKLVKEAQATVVPVYFHGRNSRKFHVASHIAEPLRMGMLLHEAVNKFGRSVKVSIGEPIYWNDQLNELGRRDLTEQLYNSVSNLKGL